MEEDSALAEDGKQQTPVKDAVSVAVAIVAVRISTLRREEECCEWVPSPSFKSSFWFAITAAAKGNRIRRVQVSDTSHIVVAVVDDAG